MLTRWQALIMDPLILFSARRNKGIYEPEYRLIPAVLGLVGGGGLVAYAYVVQTKGDLYLASFLWGLTLFGMVS